MRQLVQDLVRSCVTCQRYKSEHLHPAGLLPLPVPQGVWMDIGLDIVEALPRVRGKSVIFTVVARFSKYCHFIPLGHPYSAESVAQAFFTDIVRLHGVPQSMVSDCHPMLRRHYLRSITAPRSQNRRRQSGPGWHEESARFLSSGRGRALHRLRGRTSTPSPPSIRTSSSRTSCSSTGGEMSCGGARTPGGPETCTAQRNARASGTPRSPRQAPALVWIRQVARLEEIL